MSPLARESPLRVARGVDPGILIFFMGLFTLLTAVRQTGATQFMADQIARAGSGGFVIATAVLSNVVSNVPAVMLLLPGVTTQAQAMLLAVTSTLAGNLTFFGSAATVIVAETARSRGAEFDAGKFTLIGLPLGAITLVVAWLWLG
ncbi:MAG: SLC13 family permease [Candidatus Thermoplasmatota archaeon]